MSWRGLLLGSAMARAHEGSGLVRISPAELDAIVAGNVDLALRRWDRPRVLVGTRMRTRVGLVEVTAVEEVDPDLLSEDDARRAGAADLAAVQRGLAAHAERPVFRVALRFAGEDSRAVPRRTPPTHSQVADLHARRRPPAPEGTPLPSIGAPATRALRTAGLSTLEAVARTSVAELRAMHGVGPIAVTRLAAALDAAGLAFEG